ncbi:MAG: histidine phosphatase family protein, partial [Candidatus Neoclostridium sp.]
MTTVLLIRHGFSVTNQRGIFTGQTDVALDEIGVKQALLTADFVFDRYDVDEIYSSDLIRALDTAAPLAEKTGKTIIKDARLREIYGGVWEGKKVEDIIRVYPDEYHIWKINIGIGRPVGGESVAELQA